MPLSLKTQKTAHRSPAPLSLLGLSMDAQPALPLPAPQLDLPAASSSDYTPRCPKDTVLYGVVAGANLHANLGVPARDRRRLERLCRHVAHPPITAERLEQLDDGRSLYRLKHCWRDGSTHMIYTPMKFTEKLSARGFAPRFLLVRYYGVLAPRTPWRDLAVPAARESRTPSGANCCSADHGADSATRRAESDSPAGESSSSCGSGPARPVPDIRIAPCGGPRV